MEKREGKGATLTIYLWREKDKVWCKASDEVEERERNTRRACLFIARKTRGEIFLSFFCFARENKQTKYRTRRKKNTILGCIAWSVAGCLIGRVGRDTKEKGERHVQTNIHSKGARKDGSPWQRQAFNVHWYWRRSMAHIGVFALMNWTAVNNNKGQERQRKKRWANKQTTIGPTKLNLTTTSNQQTNNNNDQHRRHWHCQQQQRPQQQQGEAQTSTSNGLLLKGMTFSSWTADWSRMVWLLLLTHFSL